MKVLKWTIISQLSTPYFSTNNYSKSTKLIKPFNKALKSKFILMFFDSVYPIQHVLPTP